MAEVVRDFRTSDKSMPGTNFAAVTVLCVTAAIASALLTLVRELPIGTYYWDIYFFADAAHRIRGGEVPHQDFFLSVGALPYYLYELLWRVWPDGQPLLLGQYSLLIVTLPLMLAVVLSAGVSAGRVVAVVLPFAFFSLAPINSNEFVSVPSVDGYGLYNRQAGLLLYVLASALALVRRQLVLGTIVGLSAAALFFLKITGFVAGAGFVGVAVLAGRLGPKAIAAGLVAFLVPLALVELGLGIVSLYIADVLAMLSHNSGGFIGRFLRLVSHELDVLAPAAVLCGALAYLERGRLVAALTTPFPENVTGLFSLTSVQLALMTGFAILFEMQNTGSQEFIYLWPLLSGLLIPGHQLEGRWRVVIITLVAVTALSLITKTVHRLGRALAIMPAQISLDLPELGILNSVSARDDYIRRAEKLRAHFADNVNGYRTLISEGEDPSFLYYTTPDTQILYLIDVAEGIKAIRHHEEATGNHYASLAGLDYVDPLPMLMGRQGAKAMPMGLDPTRGYPAARHDDYRAGLAQVDAILEPICPLVDQRAAIRAIAEPVLEGRRKVQIDPCWVLYEKP